MRAQLVVAFVIEAFDGRLLDRPVHSLDLTIGPRMVWLGQAVLDPICLADHIEAHLARIRCVPVPGLLGELDAIVGQDRVDAVGNLLEQVLKKFPGCLAIGLFDKLGDRELAGSINAHKEIELSFLSLNLGDVDVEEADRVTFERLALWFVPLDIRQARDAVPMKAAMQCRS